MRTTEIVLEMALDAGFDLAGVAPIRPPRDAEHFERWLASDHHAGMEWLARNADRITNPGQILPAGRSMLVVGLGHSRPAVTLEDGARIARYAAGRDYHNLIGKRLRKLVARLRREGLASDARSIVDAGPLLERSHAEEAGLGFLSKAANLLHPTFGPWFFLGEVLLDTELEPTTEAMPAGSCGTCTACIDACPTSAIVEPGSIDSRLCISYWTIEHRGSVPEELREPVGEWAFGCDICSEVCPWGNKAPDLGDRYGLHPSLEGTSLVDWLEPRTDEEHAARFEGSPLRRPGREGLARNAAMGLAVRPSEGGLLALIHALEHDPSPVVRETAAWALGQGHASDARAREALSRATGDGDPAVRAAARAALER